MQKLMSVFLMYRVELKVLLFLLKIAWKLSFVPNVPCGVESNELFYLVLEELDEFLMYRVELKEARPCDEISEEGQHPFP